MPPVVVDHVLVGTVIWLAFVVLRLSEWSSVAAFIIYMVLVWMFGGLFAVSQRIRHPFEQICLNPWVCPLRISDIADDTAASVHNMYDNLKRDVNAFASQTRAPGAQ